jgi:uncharacterized protein (TIGR02246 family)
MTNHGKTSNQSMKPMRPLQENLGELPRHPRVDYLNLVRRIRAPLLCVALVIIGLAPVRANRADDEKEILRLVDTINKAWLKHDTATISSIVADDFQSWSFKGARRGKADLLRTVEKNDESDTKVDDPVVRVYGDAAVYTAIITDSGKRPNGEIFTSKTCVTDIYICRSGRWQLVASHESLLPDGT